jgi:hypothetical protein
MNIEDVVELNKATGDLYWKPRLPHMFSAKGQRSAAGCCANWNARYAGKKCLTAIGSHGYFHGNLMGKGVLAHRIVFQLFYGYKPIGVDHINGNRLDNRPCNLREATASQNSANSKSRKGSTSKYLGVCWSKNHGKWIACITTNGKTHHIGLFESEIEAAIAYNKAAKNTHGVFARPNVIDSKN